MMRSKHILRLGMCAITAGLAQLHAQVSAPGPGVQVLSGLQSLPAGTTFQSVLSNATALAKSQNITAAENALTVFNLSAPNTANWHLETTQKLMQMAGDLARQAGNAATVNAVALQSLTHLQQASAMAKDAPTQAQSKAAAALIYLRFLGDPTSAITYYQAAAKLAPKDPAIQQALTRLQSADAKMRARIHPPKS